MTIFLNIHDLWIGQCPLLGVSLYVWVQGCPRRCPGCFNVEALDEHKQAQQFSPQEVAWHCLRANGGLVLSGGEPFSQSKNLAKVCSLIRAEHQETPILAYTGYTFQELIREQREGWMDFLKQVDVLIDGPFDKEHLIDDPLMGSSNQRIFLLSSRISSQKLLQVRPPQIQIGLERNGRIRVVGTGRGELNMSSLVERLRLQGVILE